MGRQSIVLFFKGAPESLPPVLSVASIIAEIGYELTMIVERCDPSTRDRLESKGVRLLTTILEKGPKKYRLHAWMAYRRRAWKLFQTVDDSTLIWVGSGDTALALGHALLSRRYLLQLHELYDGVWHYRLFLRQMIRKAQDVIVPEICRAAIIQNWYSLPKAPVVLPNKGVLHCRTSRQTVECLAAREILSELQEGSRIVLYQGHIGLSRDLRLVAQAVTQLGSRWQLVLMGRCHEKAILDQLVQLCPGLRHIPFINPPLHLQITSYASVGVVAYPHDSLNNMFCAPNKIWEYSSFGIPMLCNDVVGLRLTVGAAGAGICTPFDSSEGIANALKLLVENYEMYRASSFKFYESVNVHRILADVLRRHI